MVTKNQVKKITIVTPVYNESESLVRYHETIERQLFGLNGYDFNVILIDDGSEDNSWDIIKKICEVDKRFSAHRLSRNMGSHIAICCGLDSANGDAIAVLACDLQDPPEVLLKMIERWEWGADIVWGRRVSRNEARWRIISSQFFAVLLKRFAMPKGSKFTTGSFLVMDAKVLSYVRKFREHNRITFAIVAWTGFSQDVVNYERPARESGQSGWKLASMFKAMYDAFIGFSLFPVKCITTLGVLLSVGNLLFILYLVVSWMFGDPRPGWTSLMAFNSLLFGILFLMLGIIGEYLARIYSEVVARPLFCIRDSCGLIPQGNKLN
ncbi:MAG: glycosyltransferase family 2 protein [Pseudomonadota bacterium]